MSSENQAAKIELNFFLSKIKQQNSNDFRGGGAGGLLNYHYMSGSYCGARGCTIKDFN